MLQIQSVSRVRAAVAALLFNAVCAAVLPSQGTSSSAASAQGQNPQARAVQCPSCAEWNAPQKPFRVFGNTWYVGTHGLTALLITSASGHVLVDGGLPESASVIAAHVAELGFRMEDVKLIVNSHVHYDHAGGISELQQLSGARVAASAPSARVLSAGDSFSDDPQFGLTLPFPKVRDVEVVRNNQTLRAGDNSITARFTGGHTPGGTTWTWVSCEGTLCLNIVYADSQTPISADGFFFTRSKTYPTGVQDFEHGYRALEQVRCDILLTPHPDASGLWKRVAARDSGVSNALIDSSACQRYALAAREKLKARIAVEQGVKKPSRR